MIFEMDKCTEKIMSYVWEYLCSYSREIHIPVKKMRGIKFKWAAVTVCDHTPWNTSLTNTSLAYETGNGRIFNNFIILS